MNIKHMIRQAGFTMIELLVVIAVIGVLAVAVLSSINPIEQINKGRDTGHRTDAAQLINAVDRYYAIHEIYPWNDGTYNTVHLSGTSQVAITALPGGAPLNCTSTVNNGSVGGSFCKLLKADFNDWQNTWLFALTDTAEVKDGFVQRLANAAPGTELWLSKAAGGNATMYACFAPASKAFQKEALDACKDHYSTMPLGACPAGANGYNPEPLYTDELICLP